MCENHDQIMGRELFKRHIMEKHEDMVVSMLDLLLEGERTRFAIGQIRNQRD